MSTSLILRRFRRFLIKAMYWKSIREAWPKFSARFEAKNIDKGGFYTFFCPENKTGNEKSNKRWNLTRNAEPEREAFPPHPGMSSYCESNNLALAYIDSYFDSSSVPFYFPFVSAFLEISLAKAEKGLKVRLPVGRNSLVLRQFHQASP